ncbi:unnamed protein product [Trichogramma brassicae]|uniref:PRANC domain-containing protein n=1 Tax=Trichogramma brassicae TaxID=86971 RepID=A0A6H5J632_9HYME|nr:unnamed protein product [Trichogramma brassicae]
MREAVNWEIEDERREFFNKLKVLISDWHDQLPNLKNVFQREEIDWLLTEFVKTDDGRYKPDTLVDFVSKTDYKDEPDLDTDGKPLSRRTTPHAAKIKPSPLSRWDDIVSDLFRIYDRFDVNYMDESGVTHFHVACKYGCFEEVREFLESGLDPDCHAHESDPVCFDPPLHLCLENQTLGVLKMLMRYGANVNVTNGDGMTALHIISVRSLDMMFASKLLFENDDDYEVVKVDAKDRLGRTPLHCAVAYLRPDMIDVLMHHGAKLSNFVFPTVDQFDAAFETFEFEGFAVKLELTCAVLEVVERLEARGYELVRSDAKTIMTTLHRHLLLDVSENRQFWRNFEKFVNMAKELMMKSSLSLYDLLELRPKQAKQLFKHTDYLKFTSSKKLKKLPREFRAACVTQLCEQMCRGFFQRWTLQPFLQLTRRRLPILCCEMILEHLVNKDLLSVCQAGEIVSNEQSRNIDLSHYQGFCLKPAEEKLKKLKCLREMTDWEIEDERQAIFEILQILIMGWRHELPDLREIFRREEMDWLLSEFIKSDYYKLDEENLIHFVLNTGYKDEPEQEPSARRTTPVHLMLEHENSFIIGKLFRIYDRFDVNYVDERGLTHFHVACAYGCEDVVRKFLELGQDPNCLDGEASYDDPPLHLALTSEHKKVVSLLLQSGADPNRTNVDEMTALHLICQKSYETEWAEMLFDGKQQRAVLIDARDKSGRTPLQIAVTNICPHLVRLLLDRGADLSGFVFPTVSHFDATFQFHKCLFKWGFHKLQLASDALVIVELLEQKGYELARSDAVTIMKTLIKHSFFDKAEEIQLWRRDEDFMSKAKEIMIIPSLSLCDSIEMRPEKAMKQLTYQDYFKIAFCKTWEKLAEEIREPCVAHLCEKIWERFYQRWALEPLMKLTGQRLPILCCEHIMKKLENEDLLGICLAGEIVENEPN